MSKRFDEDRPRRDRGRVRRSRGRQDVELGSTDGGGPGRESRRTHADDPQRNQRLENIIQAHLESAGYGVAFRDDELWVDNALVGSGLRNRLVGHRVTRGLLRDERAFGSIVSRFLVDVLKRRARAEVAGLDQNLHLSDDPREQGTVIVRKGPEPVARVTATSFRTASGEYVSGSFWAPGEHWTRALVLLLPRGQRDRVSQPDVAIAPTAIVPAERPTPLPATTRRQHPPIRQDPPPARDLVAKWPADATSRVTWLAAQASRRLRDHRGRADEIRVELVHGANIGVAFDPLERDRRTGRLDLPFEASTPAGELHGRIHLGSPNPQMAIRVTRRVGTLPLAEGWALALRAAADRFCVEPDSDPGDEPRGFAPDRATAEMQRHRVSAHLTRLPDGHRATDDAVKAAEDVGIELPSGYTWTRSHLRGGKGDEDADRVLRYRWSPQDDGPSVEEAA
jgi:hypothetical protein